MSIQEIVAKHFGHSSNYLKDGINALNTAFVEGGVFIHVKKGQIAEHPVYIYNITDARSGNVFIPATQPGPYRRKCTGTDWWKHYATLGPNGKFYQPGNGNNC